MSNNEADTCRKFVVPKLQAAGWGNDPQPNWNGEMIKDIKIALPPRNQQMELVRELDAMQARSDALRTLQDETVHHIVPLSSGLAMKTKLTDVSLLCANCHRIIHRAIRLSGRWMGILDAKELLGAHYFDKPAGIVDA
jgi:hypothetical protein